MREKLEVPAVRDRDLRNVLQGYGLTEKIDNGQLTCKSCSQILTWDNIGALVVKGKDLLLFCDLSECIDLATRKGN